MHRRWKRIRGKRRDAQVEDFREHLASITMDAQQKICALVMMYALSVAPEGELK